MNKPHTHRIKILDKTYQIACSPEQQGLLQRAARELDQRMRAVRAGGTVIGSERIAIIALNLCREVQELKGASREGQNEEQLNQMADKLDRTLTLFKQEQQKTEDQVK